MKKFSFSLEKAYEYKTHREKNEKSALKRLANRRDILNAERDILIKRQRLCVGDYEKRCREGIPAGQASVLRDGLHVLEKAIDRTQNSIKEIEKEIACQVNKLLLLSEEKSSLEKLREKQLVRYKYEQDKETERFIDDFVSNSRHRSKTQ